MDRTVVAITETREVSPHDGPPEVDVPSKERFKDPSAPEEETAEHPFVWTTPPGWTEGQPSQMRVIDLKFGPNGEGECYLSVMMGASGGLLPNINRWRGQMGLEPMPEADVEKLPKKMFLGDEVPYVSVDGAYKNVGQEAALPGYRLLGLIQQAPELTLFVKMTGPKELIEANQAAFDAFIQSLQFRKKSPPAPPR